MNVTSFSIIASLIAAFVVLWLYVFLPISMARKRERSKLGWMLIFWITSPLLGIILLCILGDSKQKIRRDIIDELKKK